MERGGGRNARGGRRHGEAARGRGPGGLQGRRHGPEQAWAPGHAAAGDPQGRPRKGEEGNSGGRGEGDGGRGLRDSDESRRLGGPAAEEDGEKGNASGGGGHGGRRGWDNSDAEQERLHLGAPGHHAVQYYSQAASGSRDCAAGEGAGFPRGGVPAQSDGRRQDRPESKEGNARGGGSLSSASATSRHQAACPTVEPEGKKWALPASAAPTPLLPWSSSLSDAFLLWTIKDVMNDNLYKGKVNHIPSKFDSPDHFTAVYSGLLIEETRSAICASIQNLSENQYFKLLSVEKCESPSLFFLDVDLLATRSDEIQSQHVARDFDACLLSSGCPKDSDFDVMSCYLGLTVGVGRYTPFQKSFRVLVSDHEMFQPDKIKFVIFLSNIKYNMEISRMLSLHHEENQTAIKALLELHRTVGKKCKVCAADKQALLSMKKDGGDVISSLISTVSCSHQCHTEVVWAPAGNMKDCITTLMKYFLHLRPRMLICLPNEACLADFIMDVKDFLGTSDAFGDVLLLSNPRDLENCGNVERFLLKNRSHEVYCSFRLGKGLLKMMSGLLDLSGFHHSPRCPGSNTCERCSDHKLLSFSVELFAERFSDIKMHLDDYLVYFVNHASSLCLPEKDCDSIVELLHLMKQIEALLQQKTLREDCVKGTFKLILAPDAVDSADCTEKSLNDYRMSCIRLIAELNNSLGLPLMENRDEVDKICIQHSRIIITSIDCMWKMHGLEIDAFDVLIVSGANQIKASDMLLPLALPLRHAIFFGDHLHVQTAVHSKICQEAGFGKSIYEILQESASRKQALTHKCVRHPLILKILNTYLYNGTLEYDPIIPLNCNKESESLGLPYISIVDAPSMECSHSRKGYINSATLFILLQQLSKDLMYLDRKFSVCVVCLSSKEANTVGDQLGTMNEINDRCNLQVKFIDNLEGNLFDVIIISTIVEDDTERHCVSKSSLNVALTSARHCCYVVGRSKTLVKSGGIWKELLKYARDQKVIIMVQTHEVIEVMKKFEKMDINHIGDPNCIFSRKTAQEFTWVHRPHRTKYILPDVRDQRGQPDTCIFQASCGAVESLMKLHNANLSPPQDCEWDLSVDDLKSKYESSVGKKLMSEDTTDRGKRRLQVVLKSFKTHGVLGRHKTRNKSRIIKILSYEEVDPSKTAHVTKLLEEGNIMVGHFKISWNFFTLKPNEVYAFDEKKAFIHPKSNLVASHAVMMVGNGHQQTAPKRFLRFMVMQNSEGKLFGIDGIGRVRNVNTVRGLFRLVVEIPKEGLLD